MNLKERGITVGDLLIVLMIILFSTILVKTFNKDKKTSYIPTNQITSCSKIFNKNII